MSLDSVHYLRPAMAPRSIAVVGASPRHDSLGRFVYTNVMAAGFKGEVYAVNPRHRTIDGHPCLPSLSALPAKVDLAVVVTGAQNVPGIIDEAGRKGIPAMLVLSPGLCEEGPERRALEREVLDRARARAGARIRTQLPGPDAAGYRTERQLGQDDGAARRAGAGVAVRRDHDRAARLRVDCRASDSRRWSPPARSPMSRSRRSWTTSPVTPRRARSCCTSKASTMRGRCCRAFALRPASSRSSC